LAFYIPWRNIKTDIVSKKFDIINFVVSLIIEAVAIPFLSNQSHQPIRRTKKSPFSRAVKCQNSSKNHLFSGAEKHPDFQVTLCLQNVSTNVDFIYTESE